MAPRTATEDRDSAAAKRAHRVHPDAPRVRRRPALRVRDGEHRSRRAKVTTMMSAREGPTPQQAAERRHFARTLVPAAGLAVPPVAPRVGPAEANPFEAFLRAE